MDDLSTVLLVEDNPDDAELIRHAFMKAGVANPLIVVDDGDKAIDYLHGRSIYADRAAFPLPGLFLLDLKLPRRSGFEVLESIRANRPTRNIPVIVLTSSNQANDIERAYELGANSYLVKPIGRDALITMVRSLDAFWLKLNQASAS
ncbi:response regulator [uncultured Sphingomonas sp.]|uniref:response regulator n=1 Tax=uncultured Sphingomonas sp. TaxID=158754 RepID=UPI0035CC31CE